MVKATGEVFVNQIYTQLPVSTGEGCFCESECVDLQLMGHPSP